jgi:hypothetical protein
LRSRRVYGLRITFLRRTGVRPTRTTPRTRSRRSTKTGTWPGTCFANSLARVDVAPVSNCRRGPSRRVDHPRGARNNPFIRKSDVHTTPAAPDGARGIDIICPPFPLLRDRFGISAADPVAAPQAASQTVKAMPRQ